MCHAGEIPDSLGRLGNLRGLHLAENNLTGESFCKKTSRGKTRPLEQQLFVGPHRCIGRTNSKTNGKSLQFVFFVLAQDLFPRHSGL